MKKVVFVVLSHTLTPEQIADLGDAQIILLSDVAPELAEQCKSIDPAASLEDVQELAAAVVAEAVKAESTHFVCQGEPCLALWANLLANGTYWYYNGEIESCDVVGQAEIVDNPKNISLRGYMTCLQSTTARSAVEETLPDGKVIKKSIFKHVQWRNMF